MLRRRNLLLAVLGAVLLPLWCPAKRPPLTDKIWIMLKPVQCLGNPWEKYWLRMHKNKGSAYPRAKELDVLKEYFKKKGVKILEIRLKPFEKGQPICETCNCPRGDTLFLKIKAVDAFKMARLGYTERFPEQSENSSKHAPP